MKTVAIISEYNPFHNGHLYHTQKIREEFGSETAIIAIMSGNFVQRAEAAIMEKWDRAKIATEAGVNLVIELPFPYSAASAEYFAKAGVSIANSIGVVDVLSFGSECGNVNALSTVAENIMSKEFNEEVKRLTKESASVGFAKNREIAYKNLYGNSVDITTPNNILAIEYIKALKQIGSNIIPHTIKRCGAGYNTNSYDESGVQSATYIRKLFNENNYSAEGYIPEFAENYISDLINKKEFPCNSEKLWPAISSNIIKVDIDEFASFAECGGGLADRLKAKANEATSLASLTTLSSTKKYTTARIKRAMLFSFFGVTSSDLTEQPAYTQVLAMDKIGQALLKKIKKASSIPAITRPSSRGEDKTALRKQKDKADMADSVFQLTKPVCACAASIYRKTPYVKK